MFGFRTLGWHLQRMHVQSILNFLPLLFNELTLIWNVHFYGSLDLVDVKEQHVSLSHPPIQPLMTKRTTNICCTSGYIVIRFFYYFWIARKYDFFISCQKLYFTLNINDEMDCLKIISFYILLSCHFIIWNLIRLRFQIEFIN